MSIHSRRIRTVGRFHRAEFFVWISSKIFNISSVLLIFNQSDTGLRAALGPERVAELIAMMVNIVSILFLVEKRLILNFMIFANFRKKIKKIEKIEKSTTKNVWQCAARSYRHSYTHHVTESHTISDLATTYRRTSSLTFLATHRASYGAAARAQQSNVGTSRPSFASVWTVTACVCSQFIGTF